MESNKKLNKNKQNKTFQNKHIRLEIAALDQFDLPLVTGEKVRSHTDIIHSDVGCKNSCCNSDCLQFLIQFFICFLVFTFSRFFHEVLAWGLQ